MNLPQLIDNRSLASMAAPDETMAVRVIIRQVFNTKPYRIRGRIRHYLAAHDPKLNAHVLDVPVSVWMKDFPTGTYKDNPSIAHDLQGNRMGAGMSPLLFAVIPWKRADAAVAASDPEQESDGPPPQPFVALRKLAGTLGAPNLLLSAIDLAASTDRTPTEIEKALLDTTANVEAEIKKAPDGEEPAASTAQDPTVSAKSNAQRQKEYRERLAAKKAAKKAATKTGKLKPEPAKA